MASNSHGCSSVILTLLSPVIKPIIPSSGPLILQATRECDDLDGWTSYYNDNNTPQNTSDDILLLSVKKNGNGIGHIGDGTFELNVAAIAGAGSNTGVLLTNPLITNSSGFWVMNRYWSVHSTTQPVSPVGIRFYFNTLDLNDVNGSYPAHNLNFTNLLFYKTTGGNPDPTSNLAGAERIASITNASIPDTTKWVYTALAANRHMAEFTVTGFSGGGGATGNRQTLPVKLTSFSATQQNHNVQLQWTADVQSGVKSYDIEKSNDGVVFEFAASVPAASRSSYNWFDKTAGGITGKIFYKLKVIEYTGSFYYSSITSVSLPSGDAQIFITPNPAKNTITIGSSKALEKNLELSIFNNLGKKAIQKKLVNGISEKISVVGLRDRLYHVIIKDETGQSYQVKMVISK